MQKKDKKNMNAAQYYTFKGIFTKDLMNTGGID